MKSQPAFYGWVFGALLFTSPEAGLSLMNQGQSPESAGPIQVAQFSAWRPCKNPNQLIKLGMNKGEVLAIAGKPDHEESYYQSGPRGLTVISDWYYTRTGDNAETTLLKFVGDSLVSITSTPIR